MVGLSHFEMEAEVVFRSFSFAPFLRRNLQPHSALQTLRLKATISSARPFQQIQSETTSASVSMVGLSHFEMEAEVVFLMDCNDGNRILAPEVTASGIVRH